MAVYRALEAACLLDNERAVSQGLGFRVEPLKLRALGFGLWASGFGLRALGFGLWASGLGLRG
jgi:hypothetical protein